MTKPVPEPVRAQLRKTLRLLRSLYGQVGTLTLDCHCRAMMRVIEEVRETPEMEEQNNG